MLPMPSSPSARLFARASAARVHGDWRAHRGQASGAVTAIAAATADLRRGRQAVVEIDGQLDEILDCLSAPSLQAVRDGVKRLARDLPDRMAASSRRAGEALTRVAALCTDGPAGSELF